MIITNKINMDLKRQPWIAAIDAVQDDRYSRNLELTLLSGGEIWTVPENADVLIRYSKADGTGGIYDTLPDGTTAWSAEGNCLTVALAPQVLTVPGTVSLAVTLTCGAHQITTFAILINVHPAVDAEIADSESYVRIFGFLPAPADAAAGQFLRISAVDENGHVTAVDSAAGTGVGAETYIEADGVGQQQNASAPENEIWSQWNSRLSFGMDTQNAPAPFHVGGQLLADGTIIAHNNGTMDKNRWGFHVLEAYAKDNFSRMTVLLDKHTAEADGKPSLELYYYTGSDHNAVSYGNTKIGSDVAFHSFCFDRDKLTAYGEIDGKMPISLASISLAKDLDTSYGSVSAADAAYEAENYPEENSKCLKYLALKNARDGAMFYDADRQQLVCKIAGKWCSLPFTVIEDAAFDIFDAAEEAPETGTAVEWASGVIDGNGDIVANTARLYTTNYLPVNALSIAAEDGYEFCLIPYSDEGVPSVPSPYYNPSTGQLEGGAVYYTQIDLSTVSISGFPNYKLIARRTDYADMDPSEGENIVVTCSDQSTDSAAVEWRNGIIDGNGDIAENTARLYTPDYIPAESVSVTADEGYEFCVVPYNAEGLTNAPNPYYNPETGSFSSTGSMWYTTVDLSSISLGTGWIESESEFTNFKLIARRTDLADIDPSEGEHIVIA